MVSAGWSNETAMCNTKHKALDRPRQLSDHEAAAVTRLGPDATIAGQIVSRI
jgi:hypothetical protein